jgi:hypothetical protein
MFLQFLSAARKRDKPWIELEAIGKYYRCPNKSDTMGGTMHDTKKTTLTRWS